MKVSLLLSSLTLAFAGAYAQAEDTANGSEFQHQAPNAAIEVTPVINYTDRVYSVQNVNNLTKIETHGATEGLIGEYGVNQMISVGIDLHYTSISKDISPTPSSGVSTFTSKGMLDPDLFVNARMMIGPGDLRFGTHLSFNMDKIKVQTNGNSNAASGGAVLTPFVGYEITSGPAIYGARLTYELYKADRKEVDSNTNAADTNSTISKGNMLSLAGFYEYDMKPWTLGAALSVTSAPATSIQPDGQPSSVRNDGSTTWGLQVYAPVTVATNVLLLPRLAYNTQTAKDSNYSSVNEYQVELGARFTF